MATTIEKHNRTSSRQGATRTPRVVTARRSQLSTSRQKIRDGRSRRTRFARGTTQRSGSTEPLAYTSDAERGPIPHSRSMVAACVALALVVIGALGLYLKSMEHQNELDSVRAEITEQRERREALVYQTSELRDPDEVLRLAESGLGMVEPVGSQTVTPQPIGIGPSNAPVEEQLVEVVGAGQ